MTGINPGKRNKNPTAVTRLDLAFECEKVIAALGNSPETILQYSSGTSGTPLVFPRRQSDIVDTFRRVASYFVARHGHLPQRVALVGGISHMEASNKFSLGEIAVESFEPGDWKSIASFDPDAISIYPNLFRELAAAPGINLRSLKAIKLGGERVYQSDVAKAHKRFKGVQVLEQFGSTEMPAIALREHIDGIFNEVFTLDHTRFAFLCDMETDGWQPILVRDNFGDLLVELPGYYDTGDELLIHSGKVCEIRRAGDPANAFFSAMELCLAEGCTNLQFDLGNRLFFYTGNTEIFKPVTVNGVDFVPRKCDSLSFGRNSGKLPVLVSSHAALN